MTVLELLLLEYQYYQEEDYKHADKRIIELQFWNSWY